MAYSINEQYSRDIDWYFVDGKKQLIHVASGGGILPNSIQQQDDFIDELHSDVLGLSEEAEIIINPLLGQIKSFETDANRNLYLRDFVAMAKRGLISLDKTNLGNFEDTHYHLVAWPKFPLQIISLEKYFESISKSDEIVSTSLHLSFDLFNIIK